MRRKNEEYEKEEVAIMRELDHLLNYKSQNIPVIFNSDPRGYALKIDNVAAHNLKIYCDWGGYGIIAPDFN